MRGPVINTSDALRSKKDGVTWFDNGTKVATRSKVNLVGITIADDPATKIVTITGGGGGWPSSNKRLTMLSTRAHDTTPTLDYLFSPTPVESFGSRSFISDSTGSYIRYVSGSVASNTAGPAVSTAWDSVDADQLPDITFVWRQTITVLTNYRIWVCVTSTAPMTTDTPTANFAGFRASSAASDTNFQCYSNDNSGGGTLTDSGVAIPNSVTRFVFRMQFVSSSELRFYIDGSLVATHTTNLPIGGNKMGFLCRAATLFTGVTKGLDFSHCYALET